MLSNHFRIAWRNVRKSKVYSLINIGGLATGMAVALLIGLWIYDEISYDKYNKNYDRIAQVMQTQNFNGQLNTWQTLPYHLGEVLRTDYGADFDQVVMSSWDFNKVLSYGDKKLRKIGKFMEAGGPALMDVTMITGSRDALKEPDAILLSVSTAKAYFGNDDPVGKVLKLDNHTNLTVKGVYRDLPYNSAFGNIGYIAPWTVYIDNYISWVKTAKDPWGVNAFLAYVQIGRNADLQNVSRKIRNAKFDHVSEEDKRFQAQVFLHPMSKWHLYEEFKNGFNTGGRIQFVWLFGIIGAFVLLLACINFMNLSTARSEKRAREVGIRKAVGSVRSQLIGQFFVESLVVVALGFIFAVVFTQLALPFFNDVADKKIHMPWGNISFWLTGILFILLTGLIAGSYPALFLSSFQPVKVLKGTFRAGRYASMPRKALVVLQFTVSLVLIIGTVIVFRQIKFAEQRPVGYSREGLLSIETSVPEIHNHFEAVRTQLKNERAIVEMAEASSPATTVWQTAGDLRWRDKDPNLTLDVPTMAVSSGYGKTVGWQFASGRDFSSDYASDSSKLVINEAAVRIMGFKNPLGEVIYLGNQPFTVIGVIKDMIAESPYKPVRPSIYLMTNGSEVITNIRINPAISSHEALAKIEAVFKKYNPEQPFEFQFVDEEYAKKFSNEVRIGKLSSAFAILAIFICCLGLFGMASYMAERRTKEIGIRKVLGASILNLWAMLSKDFLLLVIISLAVAVPLAWYFMDRWLQNYEYRAGIPWWVFLAAGIGIILITLATVSFQSIKAALLNPVKSLRAE